MPIAQASRVAFYVLLYFCATVSGVAATNGTSAGLTIETIAERRVQTANGIEYVPADQLHFGDEIFYTLRVRNSTNAAIQDAVIAKSIPRNTKYVANSAIGPACLVDFSADGGATFGSPEQLMVRRPNMASRNATTDEYTDIRWRLRHPLAPGATALLRFRATLK